METAILLLNVLLAAVGYLILAWGGGITLCYKNWWGLFVGVSGIVVGLLAIYHGFWRLIHPHVNV